jgi:dUTPase
MKFFKALPSVKAPEVDEQNGGISIFSAETVKVAWGETRAIRTGIELEIEPGTGLLLVSKMVQGIHGAFILGQLVTAADVGELRITLGNMHRDSVDVVAGSPIATGFLVDLSEIGKLEEIKEEEEEKPSKAKTEQKEKEHAPSRAHAT